MIEPIGSLKVSRWEILQPYLELTEQNQLVLFVAGPWPVEDPQAQKRLKDTLQ